MIASAATTLEEFVGSAEVLHFETETEAREAARLLRERLADSEYTVEARYHKVLIKRKKL